MFPFAVYSQETAINGMMGIPFGIDKASVISKMKSKGYTNKPTKEGYLTFENVKFGAFDAFSVNFYFTSDKLYQGLVLIIPELEAKTVEIYEEVVTELSKKYGPGNSFKNFKSPYEEGDGFDIQAIKLGKADFNTFWTKHAQGTINAYVSETLLVGIKYQDKELIKEVIKAQSTKNIQYY